MAYAFLTPTDVLARIRDEHRADLTDSTESVELVCESQAIAKVKSALNGRYNVAALFPAPADPDTRNPLVVLHVLNIFTYLMYRRINPRKMPEDVKVDHDESLEWLDRVARGKESPDFPAVEDPEISTNTALVGGREPMRGHWY